MQKPLRILCRPGLVLIPLPGGHVIRLQEKGLAAKLELLFTKSLYPIALNMARFEQVSFLYLASPAGPEQHK